MTTAFQPDLFQSNSFQIDGGVAAGSTDVTIAYTEGGDVFSFNVELPSRNVGGGTRKRRRKYRYIARHKGQIYEFETAADLEDFVSSIKEQESDKPKKSRAPIKITLSPDLVEELPEEIQVPRRLEYMPTTAALAQVRKLDYTLERWLEEMKRKADEDEEDLMMLLL